jgi:hypothetical protein
MPGLRRRPAGPGRGCEACGTFPAVTAPELEADLTGTRTLAVVHAAKLRAEASELRSQALAKHSETDRVLHVARLEERLALARLALDDATAGQPPLEAGLKRARKAEDRAARELAGASEDHARIEKAEETARRIRHGLEAETAATLQLAAAATSCAATRPRSPKPRQAAGSRDRAGGLPGTRRAAGAAATRPRPPLPTRAGSGCPPRPSPLVRPSLVKRLCGRQVQPDRRACAMPELRRSRTLRRLRPSRRHDIARRPGSVT